VGWGLASLDVVKILMLEAVSRSLAARGHEYLMGTATGYEEVLAGATVAAQQRVPAIAEHLAGHERLPAETCLGYHREGGCPAAPSGIPGGLSPVDRARATFASLDQMDPWHPAESTGQNHRRRHSGP